MAELRDDDEPLIKQLQELLSQISIPDQQVESILRQVSGPNNQSRAIIPQIGSERLVPEASYDEEISAQADERLEAEQRLPAPLQLLAGVLGGGNREYTTKGGILTFSMPAGRAEREVAVDEVGAALLAGDPDLLSWRSLTQYDGIWNPKKSVVEVALRSERHGPPPSYILRRLAADMDPVEEDSRFTVASPDGPLTLSLGRSNSSAAAILGPRRLARGPRTGPVTVRLEGCSLGTVEDTETLIERVSDSFFFDLEVTRGVSLVLSRLENRSRPERWRRQSKIDLRFPQSTYPHAPVLLYRLGRDRSVPPVIRYWALYQVLEYFFPKYANKAAADRLGRHLRSPTFDPYSQEDITKAVALSGRSSQSGEREDLAETLSSITSADELKEVVGSLGIAEHLRKTDKGLSPETVDAQADDISRQLAKRIYDVRCKIVHSKSITGRAGDGPGLIPGTAHDDLVLPELPILDYLAQQAIIASADRLQLKASPPPVPAAETASSQTL